MKNVVKTRHIWTSLTGQRRNGECGPERTSNLSVTRYLAKKYTSGLKLSTSTGTVTAMEAPHRNRVTGGILRISAQRDMLCPSSGDTWWQ